MDGQSRSVTGSPYGGDSIFVVARKTGPVASRYPALFYDVEKPA
ncbi:MAG: hypothetical protein ACE15E_16270 [Acidobacteriota bacterium]